MPKTIFSTITTTTSLLLLFFLSGCSTFSNILFDEMQGDYSFRKVRWGQSKEYVETVERGKRVFWRTPDLLIYKSVIGEVPVLLVYTFRKNKLRAAGYMTQKPVVNAEHFVKKSIDKYGMPKYDLADGMMWELPKSIVYVDGYSSHIRSRNSTYQRSAGVLESILKDEPKDDALIHRWDGVLTYIDRDFYNELAEIENPLLGLSHYEKRLFGIIKRRAGLRLRTQSGDTVTIPVETSE